MLPDRNDGGQECTGIRSEDSKNAIAPVLSLDSNLLVLGMLLVLTALNPEPSKKKRKEMHV